MNSNNKISVVLVDDSSVIRGFLARILQSDPNIEIVGSVANGEYGITIAKQKQPDILILDVEMPVMDGLSALPKIIEGSPDTKVIMFSSLTAKGADITMKAMALGAVECLVKPSSSEEKGPESLFQKNLLRIVRTLGAHKARSAPQTDSPLENRNKAPVTTISTSQARHDDFSLNNSPHQFRGKPSILAIGSSTGGPQALFNVIKNIGSINIPIVITQHMPATFTKILASHIEQQTGIPSFEGEDGMDVENGKIYVAPGGKHMVFKQVGPSLKIVLDDGPAENFCKPAVDPMLRSLINIYGQKVLCAILTGMGHDGLAGAKILVEKGGRVIAQDKETSVVWGMPGAVATEGICSAVLPLDDIGSWLKKACYA